MYKYAVVEQFGSVIDIITVSDMHTLDGYNLPDGPCSLIILNERETPIIGQKYNYSLDKFE
jgi:hypothetical protein